MDAQGFASHRATAEIGTRGLIVVAAWVFAVVGGAVPSAADDPSSSSFVLSQSALNAGGASAVSSTFVLDGSAGQPATVGAATSTSFVIESGFWNSLSARAVLTVMGAGSGHGTLSGPGIACTADTGVGSGDCSESFVRGTMLGIVASPDPANAFDGWSGCDSTSTATLAGDTCTVAMNASRTVTAAFTALATAGNRIWKDVDGDGAQDVGEPGLNGVAVILSDGGSVVASTVTAGGGLYEFENLYPGSYTVAVDALTLPVDHQPSFDPDGLATPNEVQVGLADGQLNADVDFGYQPLVDLAITKDDSEDPLPGGEALIYSIMVENLGVNAATGVTVTDILPGATSLVATSGCSEDPVGAPLCTLGTIPPGSVASFTLEVAIDPAPPAQINNFATVSSIEAEKVPANNEASQSTDLDAASPAIALLTPWAGSAAGGPIAECDTLFGGRVGGLAVVFDEPMADPAGDLQPGDVTNPESWLLVTPGADANLQTTSCGGLFGDDVSVPLAVDYDEDQHRAILWPASGLPLPESRFRIMACGTGPSVLTDRAGNPLDGDGDGFGSDDFIRSFRNDPRNALDNGHFDCRLEPWVPASLNPAEVLRVAEDVDGSTDSGAVRFQNLTGGLDFELAQCAQVIGGNGYDLSARVRMSTEAFAIGTDVGCRFYSSADCSGGSIDGPLASVVLLSDTSGDWIALGAPMTAPEEANSALCAVAFTAIDGEDFVATVDQIQLASNHEAVVFADGFESGDTAAWTVAHQ